MPEQAKPMALSSGEVALLCDWVRGFSDEERERIAEDIERSLAVFVPVPLRAQARRHFMILGLLPEAEDADEYAAD